MHQRQPAAAVHPGDHERRRHHRGRGRPARRRCPGSARSCRRRAGRSARPGRRPAAPRPAGAPKAWVSAAVGSSSRHRSPVRDRHCGSAAARVDQLQQRLVHRSGCSSISRCPASGDDDELGVGQRRGDRSAVAAGSARRGRAADHQHRAVRAGHAARASRRGDQRRIEVGDHVDRGRGDHRGAGTRPPPGRRPAPAKLSRWVITQASPAERAAPLDQAALCGARRAAPTAAAARATGPARRAGPG